jgi:hypothetical protein
LFWAAAHVALKKPGISTMPRLDPARWKEARLQWEGSLDVSYTDIAAQLGTSIPTVTLRAKRELWVKQDDVVDVTVINYSPRQLTEIAMRALVRAALQTKDTASAVKAAGLILERTMGRVVATQVTPMLPPDLQNEEQAWPDWLKSRRLAYQEGTLEAPDGTLEAAALPMVAEPPIEAPSTKADGPSHAGEPFRPRLVQPEPRFWAGPGRPAS